MKLLNQKEITNLSKIHNNLIKHKKISIFVHESPDFDAICSSLALRDYLKSKKIDAKVIGLNFADKNLIRKIYEKVQIDKYNDEFIKNSAAIILDTANSERILTKKHLLAKKVFRIDHHPKIETIGSYEWIDDKKSSTSEMIGWFILINSCKLTKVQANFLYTGILADTGRFMYKTTSESTLFLIIKFYEVKFNKLEIQDKMFSRKWENIKIDSQLYSQIKIKNNVGVLFIDKKMSKFIIDHNDNPSKVYLMNDIENLKAWICVYFDFELNVWKISLRSKWYDVRSYAQKFNGGGHTLASGIKTNNLKNVNKIIDGFVKYKFNKINNKI